MKMHSLHAHKIWEDTKPAQAMEKNITAAYDRHMDMVYRICFSMTGNTQDAEDATQSVFIKLMENKKQFIDDEHEKAWLILTSQNHCRDLLRKWWRKKVIHLDTSLIGELGKSENVPIGYIEENLLKIPPTYRLILYLFYYEGYKIAEIASMLKLNINTVKTRMRNAKKHLKLEIGDDFLE